MTTRVNLIFARSRNGIIGRDNALPWHLPQDMAHFKRLTMGAPVIMGRKTWDSLPARFRPLPGRINFVLTRRSDWRADGAVAAHSIAEVQLACAGMRPEPPELWIIGGEQIYNAALPLAQRAIVTEIDKDFDGDAHAPLLDANWKEQSRESHVADDGMPFAFVTYTRTVMPEAPVTTAG